MVFDSVISEAIKTYGLTESDVMNRGYKIYTTLNQEDQTNLQNDFDNDAMFNYVNNAQAASIVLNAKMVASGPSSVVVKRRTHSVATIVLTKRFYHLVLRLSQLLYMPLLCNVVIRLILNCQTKSCHLV